MDTPCRRGSVAADPMHFPPQTKPWDSWILRSTNDRSCNLMGNYKTELAAQKSRARQVRCLLDVVRESETALYAIRILTERICCTAETISSHLSDQCMRLCLIHLTGSLCISKEHNEVIVSFLRSPSVAESLQQSLGVIYSDLYDESLVNIKWASLLSLCRIGLSSFPSFTSTAVHQQQ